MNSSVKLNAPISDSSIAIAKSLGFFLFCDKSQICCAKNSRNFYLVYYHHWFENLPRSESLIPINVSRRPFIRSIALTIESSTSSTLALPSALNRSVFVPLLTSPVLRPRLAGSISVKKKYFQYTYIRKRNFSSEYSISLIEIIYVRNPNAFGSTRRIVNVEPTGRSLSIFATSKCRVPTNDLSLIFSIWSPTLTSALSRSITLPSLTRLIKA